MKPYHEYKRGAPANYVPNDEPLAPNDTEDIRDMRDPAKMGYAYLRNVGRIRKFRQRWEQ